MDIHKQAKNIVNAISDDLNGRKGFDLYSLDKETSAEIRQTWKKIVLAILQKG